MGITDKEREGFNHVIDTVLKPVIEENKEEIKTILDNNPEFKSRVEEKVQRIVNKRTQPQEFYVKCAIDFTVTNSTGEVIAAMEEGEEFKATLNEDTEEYFTTDSKNRPVLVGSLDYTGLLHIDQCFRLLPVSQHQFNYVYTQSNGELMEESPVYRCIRFDLFDISRQLTFQQLADSISLAFVLRGNCYLHTEEYKRSEQNIFVTVEVRGKEEEIKEAIAETQYDFDKWCEKSEHKVWTK